MVDPPETRWAGGWGTPPSRPSNQGRPGGTRGGSASPHWLAVNKRGPTPCKHASLESGREVVAVRPSLVNPGARRPHSNLTHPHWTPGPPEENPLSPRPPGGPATRGRPPDNQTAQGRRPQYLKRSSLDLPTALVLTFFLPPSLPRNRIANSNNLHLAFEESIEIRA